MFLENREIPILQKPFGPLAEIQILDTESFLSVGISPTDKISPSGECKHFCALLNNWEIIGQDWSSITKKKIKSMQYNV